MRLATRRAYGAADNRQSGRGRGRPTDIVVKTNDLRTNDQIVAGEVRLVAEDGAQAQIVPLAEAMRRARAAGLDLVEIAHAANPPVCKILDYGKLKYRQSKKQHEARARQKQVEVKEVKFRLAISDADYGVKLRNARRFAGEGNRIKASLWFRGREIVHQRLGERMMNRVRDDLADLAAVEQAPALEGKRLIMLLAPLQRERKKAEAPRADAKTATDAKSSDRRQSRNRRQRDSKKGITDAENENQQERGQAFARHG